MYHDEREVVAIPMWGKCGTPLYVLGYSEIFEHLRPSLETSHRALRRYLLGPLRVVKLPIGHQKRMDVSSSLCLPLEIRNVLPS